MQACVSNDLISEMFIVTSSLVKVSGGGTGVVICLERGANDSHNGPADAIWLEAGSKLVQSRFEAGSKLVRSWFESVCDQLRTS